MKAEHSENFKVFLKNGLLSPTGKFNRREEMELGK